MRTVDFHIQVNAWAQAGGHEVLWWERYFDWSANAYPATRFMVGQRHIVPDLSFMVQDRSGPQRLIIAEIANGMDTAKVTRQLKSYCKALDENAINYHYDYGEKAVRILFVFENRRLMELVQERADNDPWVQEYLPHFFFQSVDTMDTKTWQHGWHRPALDEGQVSLF